MLTTIWLLISYTNANFPSCTMNTFFLQASRFSDENRYDERKFLNLLRNVSSARAAKRSIEEASTPEEAEKMISQEMAEMIEQEMQRLTLQPA